MRINCFTLITTVFILFAQNVNIGEARLEKNQFNSEFLTNIFKRFKSMNNQYVAELTNNLSVPIENMCLSFYKELTKVSSKFFECTVNNSRPFHLCQNCIKYYLEVNEIKKRINSDPDLYATGLYKEGLTCMTIIEAADRVQTSLQIFNTISYIWTTSNCEGNLKVNFNFSKFLFYK